MGKVFLTWADGSNPTGHYNKDVILTFTYPKIIILFEIIFLSNIFQNDRYIPPSKYVNEILPELNRDTQWAYVLNVRSNLSYLLSTYLYNKREYVLTANIFL